MATAAAASPTDSNHSIVYFVPVGRFALFVLADASAKDVNRILQENYEQVQDWGLWISDKYENLPQTSQTGGTRNDLASDWTSPFHGKTMQQAVDFLRGMPRDYDVVDVHYFAILDETFAERGWLTLGRVGDRAGDGPLHPQTLPVNANKVTLYLQGIDAGDWEESAARWQEDGKPAL